MPDPGGQLKTGSACRPERIAKYNRLLESRQELGGIAGMYLGARFQKFVPQKALKLLLGGLLVLLAFQYIVSFASR